MNRGPVRHWIFTTACCPPEQLRRPPASRKPLREHPHSCSGRSIVQEPRARRASPPRAGGSPQARSASHTVSSTSALPVRSLRGELPLPPAHVAGPPSRTWERHLPLLPPSRAWDHHCPRARALAAALPGRHPPIRTWDRHRPCGELVQACVGSAGGGKAPERIRQQGQYCHFTSLSQLK